MPALVRPAMAHMASFVDALNEGYSRDSLRDETPEAIAAIANNHAWYLETLLNPPKTVVLPDGSLGERVPETFLWYVEGDQFLGSVSVRHKLNDVLARWGGNVGYAVRPSARGKGYASAMLAGMLDHIRTTLPLERVLLTVSVNNPASVRVIEKNGGVLADTIPHPWVPGDQGRRYWITL
ncbi:MAG TPA: GNAT family N-acetyltransferase [Phenylobacterium sp.]|jgi:predicted acetyltransferase